MRKTGAQPGNSNGLKHGHANPVSPEYQTWLDMKKRCFNPRNKNYRYYGGRGITVDPRWLSFAAFLADMGRRPDPKLTLERRDNELGYSKENCVWATRLEQVLNRRGRK